MRACGVCVEILFFFFLYRFVIKSCNLILLIFNTIKLYDLTMYIH